MKRVVCIFFFLIAIPFISLRSLDMPQVAILIIPEQFKKMTLLPFSTIQFQVFAYDKEGNYIEGFIPQWTVTDLEGFETDVPGSIDEDGYFTARAFYIGAFKIVAIDKITGKFDEAQVTIHNDQPPYYGSRLIVSPAFVYSLPGGLRQLFIQCHDGYGRVVPCYLRVNIFDQYFRSRRDVAQVFNNGLLQVYLSAQRGQYRIHFDDIFNSSHAEISLMVY